VDLGHRREVEPETGFAAIKTDTGSDSSRASTARCTLPPDSVATGASAPWVFTLNSAIYRSAWPTMARWRNHGPVDSGARSKFRRAMFSAMLMAGTHALRRGSSGRLKAR
jgi:hypothetical protein